MINVVNLVGEDRFLSMEIHGAEAIGNGKESSLKLCASIGSTPARAIIRFEGDDAFVAQRILYNGEYSVEQQIKVIHLAWKLIDGAWEISAVAK